VRLCDFCNASAIVVYRARPVVTECDLTNFKANRVERVILTAEDPDWYACEDCRALIASGRRDDLVERSRTTDVAAFGDSTLALPPSQRRRARREMRRMVRTSQDDFWSARLGPPEPLEVMP
jgi:hypothetical protein